MQVFLSFTITLALSLWVVLLLAAFFGKIFTAQLFRRHRNRHWLKNGIEANAVVLKREDIESRTGNRSQVKLQVQVKPEKGRNFVTEISDPSGLNNLSDLRAGSMIKVKYNPSNTKELILIRTV